MKRPTFSEEQLALAPPQGKPAHLRTRKERFEAGRALRESCPRASQAIVHDPVNRTDPIQLLMASSKGRIEHLIPIRYGRMLASPFAFFRGAACIMAADLAKTPSTGLRVQACGDCHLLNFGAFATPERRVIFDVNDFDETFPAPWEWDLKRLAASFVVASQTNGHRDADCRASARAVVTCYAQKLRALAEMPTLAAWSWYLDYDDLVEITDDPELKRRRKRAMSQALERDAGAELLKLGHVQGGQPRIKDQPPLIFHPDEWEREAFETVLRENLARYRLSLSPERRILFDRFELVDQAIKVVGIGSVGTLCAIGLFFAAEGDSLFLQVKEARPSVLEPYVTAPPFASSGERVVFGQRLMQAATDIFLGHVVGVQGRHLYVRQLRDVKVKPLVETFTPQNMLDFARNTGWALARSHARSADAAVIAGYIGKDGEFADALSEFATVYATQNKRDHAALVAALRSGRLEAVTESR